MNMKYTVEKSPLSNYFGWKILENGCSICAFMDEDKAKEIAQKLNRLEGLAPTLGNFIDTERT